MTHFPSPDIIKKEPKPNENGINNIEETTKNGRKFTDQTGRSKGGRPSGPPAEAASHEDVVNRMGAFPENFVVAVKNDQIVGFINGGTTDKPVLPDEFYHDITLHKKDGEIQTVFGLNVIPEYRHQGIAGELVEYFKNLAKERGKKALILTCKEHMIPFYESHGLKKLGVADSCHGGATWYDMQIWF